MNNLIKEIENAIETAIGGFTQRISAKYNIKVDDLMELWSSKDEYKIATRVVSNKVIPEKPNTCEDLNESDNLELSEISNSCPYLFTKGEKDGEYCGIKPKSGATYCSRHKKYEGIVPRQKKVFPTCKKSMASTVKNKKSPVKIVNNVMHVLRKNKVLGKLYHEETSMVFKSDKERVVIGKCVNDKLQPLTNEDIEVCMAHSFKYEKPEIVSKEITEKKVDKEIEDDEEIEDDKESEIDVKSKTITGKSAKSFKKSISTAISKTKIQNADVEEILGKLQLSVKRNKLDNKQKEFEEEDNKDESEDDNEEYDEELVEEDE